MRDFKEYICSYNKKDGWNETHSEIFFRRDYPEYVRDKAACMRELAKDSSDWKNVIRRHGILKSQLKHLLGLDKKCILTKEKIKSHFTKITLL